MSHQSTYGDLLWVFVSAQTEMANIVDQQNILQQSALDVCYMNWTEYQNRAGNGELIHDTLEWQLPYQPQTMY